MIFQIKCRSLIMPKKSKLQINLQKNLLKKNCITPTPADFDDSRLISHINQTNEISIKLIENIEGNSFIIVKIITYLFSYY